MTDPKGMEDWRDDEELPEVNRAEDDEPYDHHPTDDYIPDPAVEQCLLDEAQSHDEHNYDTGDLAMGTLPDPEIVATFDKDEEVPGPRSIGDLLVIEFARQFLERTADLTYDEADVNTASEHMRKLQDIRQKLGRTEEGYIATLGAKINAYDEMVSPKIKDERL